MTSDESWSSMLAYPTLTYVSIRCPQNTVYILLPASRAKPRLKPSHLSYHANRMSECLIPSHSV